MSVAQFGGAVAVEAGGPGGEVEQERRSGRTGYLLLLPGLLWLVIFFVVPTIQLVATGLYDPNGSLDTGYAMTWSWGNYWDVLVQYQEQFLRSFGYALIATVACVLLGYPLAYAIAFKSGRWKNLMLVLVIAPFFTSFLVRTLAWKSILADNGFVVELLKTLQVLPEDGRLLATPVAVVTGLTYNFLPFMVLPLYATLEKMDYSLIEAAQDLGCTPTQAFWKITAPLSLPGVVAGCMLVFIPAIGEFVIPDLLGGSRTLMIGKTLWNEFFANRDWPVSSAVAVILLLILVVPIVIFQYAQARAQEQGR